MSRSESKKPSIVFLSDACLLDRKSGAAQSVRAMLLALKHAGWDCHIVTMAVFDGEGEYPLTSFHPEVAWDQEGQFSAVNDGTLVHHVFKGHSTRGSQIRPWEVDQFLIKAEEKLRALRPSVVLTYGGEFLKPLLSKVQQMGARTVFYVANAAYAQQAHFAFRFIDNFLVPSQAMADLYLHQKQIQAQVLGNVVDAPMDGQLNLSVQRLATRASRYVTMINPSPEKGGLFFLNLVARALTEAPHLRFRVVESRWDRARWAAQGAEIEKLSNLEWHPFTTDMSQIFEEAAVLLVPSLWFEASGRVVAEALLSGLPVLAMKSGGIPEQLNGGGFLFDVPANMAENFAAAPPPEALAKWMQFIRVLMNDDKIYGQAVQLALTAAQKHQRSVREAEVVRVFDQMQQQPLIASIGNDPRVVGMLQDLSQRMDDALQSVNTQLMQAHNDDIPQAGERVPSGKQEPYLPVLKLSMSQPAIRNALSAIKSGDGVAARKTLEQYLRLIPRDITALGLLADIAAKEELEAQARYLMEQVVELAPGFEQGQRQLLKYLTHAGDAETALKHSKALLKKAPNQYRFKSLHAGLLVTANRFDEAVALYETFITPTRGSPHDWMQYALALKTLGHQQEAVDAYRQAIAMAPERGAVWHGLSNTKLAVFKAQDIQLMNEQLGKEMATKDDLQNIHFTLGKAFEDQKDFEASFKHYDQANSIRRSQTSFHVGQVEAYVAQVKETFTAEFFASRQGMGHSAARPVFVLGMHRAGSTLTEQILASHSQIEGTRELPYMLRIGKDFGGPRSTDKAQSFHAKMAGDLAAQEWAALGQKYMADSQKERKTDRPLFVDKMPGNWMYAGLIHLMLPQAKIIDVRRAPMSAGFALFKMNFGRGGEYSYSQQDIARYYMAYTDLMAHFDSVLPGRIHHLSYESLVENTDAEIRRLIDYCGLPFEDNCLRYWETERAVQTPSSEQVRKPIYKEAMAQWKNYEPWLGPMKAAFGLAADAGSADTRP